MRDKSETADEVGFLGVRDGDEITVADSLGGGRSFDATDDRETLIDEIRDFIVDCSRSMAESIVDDLVDDDENAEDDADE